MSDEDLREAAKEGDVEQLESLLKNKEIDINSYDDGDANTPLLLAVENEDLKSTKLLIDAKANIAYRNACGATCFEVAASTNQIEMMKLLLQARKDRMEYKRKQEEKDEEEEGEEDEENEERKYEFDSDNDADEEELLLDAVLASATQGHIEMFKLLLESNADIGTCGVSALQNAAVCEEQENVQGVKQIIQLILDSKVDVNGDVLHSTALVDVAKFIVECGGDPKLPNEDGLQPIHIAASMGNAEMVKYLVENCDIDPFEAKSRDGRSAVECAEQNNQTSVVDYLKSDNLIKSAAKRPKND